MVTKYVHTNIISRDWKKLVDFYINVFGCTPVPPERNLEGDWLEKGTGVKNAALKGMHLLLPGFEKGGPTLEIFQYNQNENKLMPPMANREGYGHIAFHVDSVEEMLEKVVAAGGKKIGEVVKKEFAKGALIFTYAADPEGNLLELQTWEAK